MNKMLLLTLLFNMQWNKYRSISRIFVNDQEQLLLKITFNLILKIIIDITLN